MRQHNAQVLEGQGPNGGVAGDMIGIVPLDELSPETVQVRGERERENKDCAHPE